MKKTTILSTILSTILVGVLVGQAPVMTIPVTESGSTTQRKIETDSTTLADGIKLGEYAKSADIPDITGKADVDGSNITPSVWRSLLDVLTSGQIDTLLEDYVKSVGGVLPDGDGDVSEIPSAALKMDMTLGFENNPTSSIWAASSTSIGELDKRLQVRARSGVPSSVIARHGEVIVGPGNYSIEAYGYEDSNNSAVITRQWAAEFVPTLQSAPAQDTVEKRYWPFVLSPEIGDGDPSWGYAGAIPSTAIDMGNDGLTQSADDALGLTQAGDDTTGVEQTGSNSTGVRQSGEQSYGVEQYGSNSIGIYQGGTGSTPFEFEGPDAANIARRGREALGVQSRPVLNRTWTTNHYEVTVDDLQVPNPVIVVDGMDDQYFGSITFASGLPIGSHITLAFPPFEDSYNVDIDNTTLIGSTSNSLGVNQDRGSSITLTKIDANTWVVN